MFFFPHRSTQLNKIRKATQTDKKLSQFGLCQARLAAPQFPCARNETERGVPGGGLLHHVLAPCPIRKPHADSEVCKTFKHLLLLIAANIINDWPAADGSQSICTAQWAPLLKSIKVVEHMGRVIN